ncbi:hypothetical protein SHIRM173S_12935 [Streptomyces hirsutus]
MSTVNPTVARASRRSPIRSGSSPSMSPRSPSPRNLQSATSTARQVGRPQRAPVDRHDVVARPHQPPPDMPTKSAATVPARATSSAGDNRAPAARRDRRKKYDNSSAPTRLTPSGVISTAVLTSAPDSPNADTSPDGVTEPPAASATTAAVIGPSEPAESASSRCSPSAAVPAIPISAQLTAATADITTSAHGTRVPCSVVPTPVAALVAPLMADPPIRSRGEVTTHVPLAWFTTLRPGFHTVNGGGRSVGRPLRKARLPVGGPSLKSFPPMFDILRLPAMGEIRGTTSVGHGVPELVLESNGRTWTLDPSRSRSALGRDPQGDVVVDNARVSSHHATISSFNGRSWVVEDHGSTNGTFAQGERIHHLEISSDTALNLGNANDGPRVTLSGAATPAASPHAQPQQPYAAQGVQGAAPGWVQQGQQQAQAQGGWQQQPSQSPQQQPAPHVPQQQGPGGTAGAAPMYGDRSPTTFHQFSLGRVMRIGRALENDLVVSDLQVSRNHAEFHSTPDGRMEIRDLGSHNGTYVNGMPIAKGGRSCSARPTSSASATRRSGSSVTGSRSSSTPVRCPSPPGT